MMELLRTRIGMRFRRENEQLTGLSVSLAAAAEKEVSKFCMNAASAHGLETTNLLAGNRHIRGHVWARVAILIRAAESQLGNRVRLGRRRPRRRPATPGTQGQRPRSDGNADGDDVSRRVAPVMYDAHIVVAK